MSFSGVEDHLEITNKRGVGWRVHLKDGTCDVLHICDFADHSYVATVAELKSEFKVEAAKGVRKLMKRLEYLTPRDMVELLVSPRCSLRPSVGIWCL